MGSVIFNPLWGGNWSLIKEDILIITSSSPNATLLCCRLMSQTLIYNSISVPLISASCCFWKIALNRMARRQERSQGYAMGLCVQGIEEISKEWGNYNWRAEDIAKAHKILERIWALELDLVSNSVSSSYLSQVSFILFHPCGGYTVYLTWLFKKLNNLMVLSR